MVLCKGVDTAPRGNDDAVVEFLGAPSAAEPQLANQERNRENDSVGDKGASHYEVGRALAEVLALADAERRDAAENHLHPGKEGHGLANDGMERPYQLANPAVDAALPVALEIDAQHDLGDEENLQDVGKAGVGIAAVEFATVVHVSEEEAQKGQAGAYYLRRDVPPRFGQLDMKISIGESGPAILQGFLTPKTMPMGKMMPYASIWTKM